MPTTITRYGIATASASQGRGCRPAKDHKAERKDGTTEQIDTEYPPVHLDTQPVEQLVGGIDLTYDFDENSKPSTAAK